MGVCTACRRFARGEVCPFCGNAVAAPLERAPGRRARNGVLAAVITAAACGGTTALPKSDGSVDAMEDSAPVPFYGAPTWDGGIMYGGPPVDSGPKDVSSDAPTDAGDGG